MKKIAKCVFGALSASAFMIMGVTGCSGVQNINNNTNGIIYNGGSVVSVGDYLFYGNGFVSGVDEFNDSSSSEYDAAKEYAYLSRINKSEYDGTKYKSSSNVQKISDRVVGYSNAYMFVSGEYIYYATPNLHQTNQNKYIWKYVSIFRSKLNGDDKKEVFTTTAYNASTAQIRALSFENKNYLIIFDGTNLVRITLDDKISTKIISDSVTGVALPKEGEQWNGDIYFTEDRNSTSNIVYKASVTDGEKEEICKENGLKVTFTGRVGNKIFYSREQDSIKETYILDLDNQQGSFASAGKWFYALEISNVTVIAENNSLLNGYLFTTNKSDSTVVMYYNISKAKENDLYLAEEFVSSGYANTVVVYDDNLYYTTSDSIIMKNIYSKQEKVIVSGMTIKAGYFGYDYKYIDDEIVRLNNIYFYATRVYDETAEDYDAENVTDQESYLYAVDASGVKDPVIFGKTK